MATLLYPYRKRRTMLKNYLKIAWRNLWKNKFYSAINVAGLTTGLVGSILILLWTQDELSFDRFHSKTKQIYQVVSLVDMGNEIKVWASTQGPVAWYALEEVPSVKNAVRILEKRPFSLFTYKEQEHTEEMTAYTEPGLFEIFDFKLIKGDRGNPFPDNSSIILTDLRQSGISGRKIHWEKP